MSSMQVSNIVYVNNFHLRGELRRRPKMFKTKNGHEFIDTYLYFEERKQDGRVFTESIQIQSFAQPIIDTLRSFENQVVVDVTGRIKNKRITITDGTTRKFLYLHVSNIAFVGNIDKKFVDEEVAEEPTPKVEEPQAPVDDDLPF